MMSKISLSKAAAIALVSVLVCGTASATSYYREGCDAYIDKDGRRIWDCPEDDHRQADKICERAKSERFRFGVAERATILIGCAHLEELREINQKLDEWLKRDKRRGRSGFSIDIPFGSSGGGLR